MRKRRFIYWCLPALTGLFFFMGVLRTQAASDTGFIDAQGLEAYEESLDDAAGKMLVRDAAKYEKAFFDERKNAWIDRNTVKYNSNYLMADWLEDDAKRLSNALVEAAGFSEAQADATIRTMGFAPGAPAGLSMLEKSVRSLDMLDDPEIEQFADLERAKAMLRTGMPLEVRYTGAEGVYSAKKISYDADGNLIFAVLQAGADEVVLQQQYDTGRHLVARQLLREDEVLFRETLDYDGMGLVTGIRSEFGSGEGIETQVTYNSRGELLTLMRTRMPDNKVIYAVDNEYGYDTRGRVSTCESHAVLSESAVEYTLHMFFVYDQDGNIITVESDGNSAETYQRDREGHCTGMISAPGGVYEYTYDQDTVCRITDTSAGVMPVITEYSPYGDIFSVTRTSVDGQTLIRYSYDEFGRCTGFTAEEGENAILQCVYEQEEEQ